MGGEGSNCRAGHGRRASLDMAPVHIQCSSCVKSDMAQRGEVEVTPICSLAVWASGIDP